MAMSKPNDSALVAKTPGGTSSPGSYDQQHGLQHRQVAQKAGQGKPAPPQNPDIRTDIETNSPYDPNSY